METTEGSLARSADEYFRLVATARLPIVSLVGSPGKRQAILDVAIEAERRGFPGLACPTLGSALGLCTSLAHVTRSIEFFTSIQGIYGTAAAEIGSIASHVHEISAGRFRLGLGVSHEAMVRRLGVPMGPPLSDMRAYVADLRANERFGGDLPPIYLAALRDRMFALAREIASGALWANASLRFTSGQVTRTPTESSFFLANMIPTVISDDRRAAAAVNRRTMTTYVRLPNYRNYWKAAGYVEEMEAIEAALERGDREALPSLMSDAWLADCTLWGDAHEVLDGFERWFEAGVRPIAVMSSVSGGQIKAVNELFEAFDARPPRR